MKVLIIDNYDSFTYNLVHLVEGFEVDTEVWRNDQINFSRIEQFDKILLSPGPGLPKEAGAMNQVIDKYSSKIPMLGICLGCQAIAEHFGASLYNMKEVKHGVKLPVKLIDNCVIYRGLQDIIDVGLYHSWAIDISDSRNLVPTAITTESVLMSFRHSTLPIYGIQYHPESIMTVEGRRIIENWLFSS